MEADETPNVKRRCHRVLGYFVAGSLWTRLDWDVCRCVAYSYFYGNCLRHVNSRSYACGEPFGYAHNKHCRTADAHCHLNTNVSSNPYTHSDAHTDLNANGYAH